MNLLKLIRLPNLFIIGFVQLGVLFMIYHRIDGQSVFFTEMIPPIICIILMTIFTGASGYISNDIYDEKIDTVNKENDVIIGKTMTKKYAWAVFFSLSALTILLAFLSRFLLGTWLYFYLILGTSFFLWWYSYFLKRTAGLGNLLVSILCAGAILIVAWPIFTTISIETKALVDLKKDVFVLAAFSFLVTLAREIIKDMQDIEGDQYGGAMTIPVTEGIPFARRLASIILILTTGLLSTFMVQKLIQRGFSFFDNLFLFLTLILLVTILIKLQKAAVKKMFGRLSLLLKVTIIAGLLAFVLI